MTSLADRVVACGVGGHTDNRTGDGKRYFEMRKFEHGMWVFDYILEESEFTQDGRVVLAMMEKVRELAEWYYMDPLWKVYIGGKYSVRNESLATAILESICDELESEK